MDVALAAAMKTFKDKNHPTIMQTSAEMLVKILGNIAKSPDQEKYRSLKTTNTTMSNKVLMAKGARQILLAVGFQQLEGKIELTMAKSAISKRVIAAVQEQLQAMLTEKVNKQRVATAEAIAKNKVHAAKIRQNEKELKLKKAALGATLKEQQLVDRAERSAPSTSTAPGEAFLQNLYNSGHVGATSASNKKPRSGAITVILFSPDGQDRLQISAAATFGDLRTKICSDLGIPEEKQVLGTDRGCNEVITSSSARLSSKGVANGSFLGLKYPGFVREGKAGFQSSVPIAERHVKARGGKHSLRDEMNKSGKTGITLQEFEELEAKRLLVPKQQTNADTPCKFVSVDKDAVAAFIAYCQGPLGLSCKRCGLLYGTWVDSEDGAGVQVDAVYEPAQENSHAALNITELEAEVHRIDEVADTLGLTRVGFIFFHPLRENPHEFWTNELLVAATLQHAAAVKARTPLAELEDSLASAWGPDKPKIEKSLPEAQKHAEAGRRFVTLKATPMRGPGQTSVNVEILAFQASEQCCEWTAAGKFHQSRTVPSQAKVTKPMKFEVEKKEVLKVDIEFFLTRIHKVTWNYTSFLSSAFAQANRIDVVQEVAPYLRSRAGRSFLDVWSDFNLLAHVARSRAIGELTAGSDLNTVLQAVSAQQADFPRATDDRIRAIFPAGSSGAFGAGAGAGGGAFGGAGCGGGGGVGGGQHAAKAQQLVQMGFQLEAATMVLEATNGNLEQVGALPTFARPRSDTDMACPAQ